MWVCKMYRKISEQVDLFLLSGDKFGRIDKDLLERAECELGVVFPAQYKDFLLEYGAFLGGGLEIYG